MKLFEDEMRALRPDGLRPCKICNHLWFDRTSENISSYLVDLIVERFVIDLINMVKVVQQKYLNLIGNQMETENIFERIHVAMNIEKTAEFRA